MASTLEAVQPAEPVERFALSSSRHFPQWLASTGGGLAFTTYRAGKAFFLGVKPDGKLSVFERSFPRCMGMGVSADGRSLLLASEFQIHRLDNVLSPSETTRDGHDALYVPHQSWITGDLDIHDIGFGSDGRPLFANTLFNCLATVSDGYSFKPVWRPPFVSKLAAEDRCHLNGLALVEGEAAYVTAVSRSDVADGWRDRRVDGGVLLRVSDGAVICEGLSMPHSPRVHDGTVWLLNSGTGEVGRVPLAGGAFEPIAFVPGFARGLAFVGGHAVIGLSLPRESRTFSGLPIDAALAARDTEPRCGLAVIDLASGDMAHWVRIEGVVRELYDVAALPGARCPAAIGFKTDEIKHLIAVDG